MTNQQHPITLPDELVKQWAHMLEQHTDAEVFNRIARWGADTELKACCEWIQSCARLPATADSLRAARCPSPPSLKKQALQALDYVPGQGADPAYLRVWADREAASLVDTVRRVLEQLDD